MVAVPLGEVMDLKTDTCIIKIKPITTIVMTPKIREKVKRQASLPTNLPEWAQDP